MKTKTTNENLVNNMSHSQTENETIKQLNETLLKYFYEVVWETYKNSENYRDIDRKYYESIGINPELLDNLIRYKGKHNFISEINSILNNWNVDIDIS